MTHTPGPWYSVRDADGDSAIFQKRNHQDLLVAVTSGDDYIGREEDDANALLIASAPEMADLLLRGYTHVTHSGPTLGEVEQVLKKAGLL